MTAPSEAGLLPGLWEPLAGVLLLAVWFRSLAGLAEVLGRPFRVWRRRRIERLIGPHAEQDRSSVPKLAELETR